MVRARIAREAEGPPGRLSAVSNYIDNAVDPDYDYADEDGDPTYFELQARVTHVSDGDTVNVLPEGGTEPIKVRLAGIDAPEMDQEYGPESRELLERLALGKSVSILIMCTLSILDCPGDDTCQCTDIYGRRVGILFEKSWRKSINKEMVEQGLAYNWRAYGLLYGAERAERRARSKRIGIWQRHGGEVRPWSHRHGGTQTPTEYMEMKEKEGANAKGPRAKARRLANEVERLRQMLSDAGIED